MMCNMQLRHALSRLRGSACVCVWPTSEDLVLNPHAPLSVWVFV